MNPEAKLAEMGLTIPEVPAPLAAYVPGMMAGQFLFTSGQIPLQGGQLQFEGVVGDSVTTDQAYQSARLCCLNCLGVIKSHLGDLSRVKQVVKVTGFVSATPEYKDHPAVINGASDLLKEVFGERGQHARAAVGVSSLPMGATTEVEMIVEFE